MYLCSRIREREKHGRVDTIEKKGMGRWDAGRFINRLSIFLKKNRVFIYDIVFLRIFAGGKNIDYGKSISNSGSDNTLVSHIISCENQVTELFVIDKGHAISPIRTKLWMRSGRRTRNDARLIS